MRAKLTLAAMLVMSMLLIFTVACNKPAARTDAQIASEVQSKIQSDPTLQGQPVSVQAANGVVTLSGNVNSDAARQAASNDAGAIEGVKQVMNNLNVQQAQMQQPQDTTSATNSANAPMTQTRSDNRPRSSRPTAQRATSTRGQNRDAGNPPGYTDYSANNATSSSGGSGTGMAAAPAPARPQTVTVPDGTTLSVRLVDSVDSETAKPGDTFRASLNAPVVVNDDVVVPEGADVEGRVVDVRAAGKFAGASLLAIELTKLQYNGHSYQIHTNQWSKQGASRGKNTAAKVGGGAALGAIIGGIAGGGKGAAIGAGVGAGAGTGVQAMGHGQQIKLGSEALLTFQLQSPVSVTPSAGSGRTPMR